MEYLRNLGATRKNEVELNAVTKSLEDKKAQDASYTGKDETERIDQLNKNAERLKLEHDDIVSGKRASRKYNGYMLEKAGMPDVSDGMEKLIKNKQDKYLDHLGVSTKQNTEIFNDRISARLFDTNLKGRNTDFDLQKSQTDQRELEKTMGTIENYGLNDKDVIGRIHDFVKQQLDRIPDETTEDSQIDLRDKLEKYDKILSDRNKSLTERDVLPERDKFDENWIFNTPENNPSGLETENKINELFDKAKSGKQEDKSYLSNPEISGTEGQIKKLKDDLFQINQTNKAFKVYRDIPEKHSGMMPGENIDEKTFGNIKNKITELSQKLIQIASASDIAQKDKELAQKRLATGELSFNHVQLSKIAASLITPLDDASSKAMIAAHNLINKIEQNNKKGIYDENLLNELEQKHNIVESYLHDKLQKEGIWKKLVSTLLTPNKDSRRYTDNKGWVDTQDEKIDKLSVAEQESRNETLETKERENLYRTKAVLNYLQQIRSVSSQKVYRALESVVKESKGIYPSYEQTNIKQAIGFLFNPDNGFINEWQNLIGQEPDNDIISNGYSQIGAAGVGKTHMFLPLILKVFKKMGGKLDGDVLLIGPTDEHINSLESAKRSADSSGKTDRLNISDFSSKSKDDLYKDYFSKEYSMIICDEASAFGRDDAVKFRNLINGDTENEGKNGKAKCLFLLDQYQSGAQEQNFSICPILERTQTGRPLEINYRTGSIDVQVLGDRLKHIVMSLHPENDYLPKARCNANETLGTKYIFKADDLFQQFHSSFDKKESPWLIVKDSKAANLAYKKLTGMGVLNSVKDNIKTISMFDKDSEYSTAQGLQNAKVYVSMDPSEFKNSVMGNDQYAKFLYTAVTRAGQSGDNKDGFCVVYMPKTEWKAENSDNLKEGEGRSQAVGVDKNALLKRLETVNKPFAGEKEEPIVTSTESKQTKKDRAQPSEGEYEPAPEGQENRSKEYPTFETDHDKLSEKGVLVMQHDESAHEETIPRLVELSKKISDS